MVSGNDYLRPGAQELFEYFRVNDIVSIIASGSTIPFLEIYNEKLRANYLVGSQPRMNGDAIDSISEGDYSGPDFKVRDSKSILDSLGIPQDTVIAIGDSPADKGIFEYAAVSIGVNPKTGMEEYIDYTVQDSLANVLPILDSLKEASA